MCNLTNWAINTSATHVLVQHETTTLIVLGVTYTCAQGPGEGGVHLLQITEACAFRGLGSSKYLRGGVRGDKGPGITRSTSSTRAQDFSPRSCTFTSNFSSFTCIQSTWMGKGSTWQTQCRNVVVFYGGRFYIITDYMHCLDGCSTSQRAPLVFLYLHVICIMTAWIISKHYIYLSVRQKFVMKKITASFAQDLFWKHCILSILSFIDYLLV